MPTRLIIILLYYDLERFLEYLKFKKSKSAKYFFRIFFCLPMQCFLLLSKKKMCGLDPYQNNCNVMI